MFFNKRSAELVAKLVASNAINTELRIANARMQTMLDTMIAQMNELRLERAELYLRIGIHVPVARMAREGDMTGASPANVPLDDNYVVPEAGRIADIGDLLNTAREIRSGDLKQPNVQGVAASEMLSFEDMGDAEATRVGAIHDKEGAVHYTR